MDGRLRTARELAEALHASEAHLSKVLQRLERAGLVKSRRGPGGGFQLARPPGEISLREVCEAVEGRYEASDCPFGLSICDGQGVLAEELGKVTGRLLEFLERTKLSAWRIQTTPKRVSCQMHTSGTRRPV